MSGSPVYVDGKLVGALAYGWPFSREPICGITPIQSMLDIRKAPRGAAGPDRRRGRARPAQFVSAFRDARLRGRPRRRCSSPLKGDAGGAGSRPLPLPVSFSGASAGQPLRPRGGGRRLARRAVGRLRRRSAAAPPGTAGRRRRRRPPRAGLGGRRRASLGRHGPVGDRHRDLGRRQLDPGLRPSVPLDGPGRHADGAGRGPDGAAVALPLVQVLDDGAGARLDLAGPLDRNPRQLRQAADDGAGDDPHDLRGRADADLPVRGRAQLDADADPRWRSRSTTC